MFFKIAYRNTLRNKRRTILSSGIVALGVAMLMLVLGFVSASLDATKEQLSREIGALQIGANILFENKAEGFEYLIPPDVLDQIIAILDDTPEVSAYSYEIGFGGIAGNREGSTLIVGRGLVPGNPIEDYGDLVLEGERLSDDGKPQIIIGQEMAEILGVAVGDGLNIATSTASGAFKAASVRIVGTIRYSNIQLERQTGFVPLSWLQRIMRTDGVERFLVRLNNLNDADRVAAEIESKMQAQGIDLETRTWEELNTLFESISQFWGVFSSFTVIGVFVLAFFSILEVLTMSFLERTREVGTIRAVGTKRFQVFSTFLIEGVILGLLGGVLGLILGVGAKFALEASGLGWLPPGAIDPVPFRVDISVIAVVVPFMTALISTVLGTLYPAARNARQNIVKSLSYV
jgi:putative ABC transport system permease protein